MPRAFIQASRWRPGAIVRRIGQAGLAEDHAAGGRSKAAVVDPLDILVVDPDIADVGKVKVTIWAA